MKLCRYERDWMGRWGVVEGAVVYAAGVGIGGIGRLRNVVTRVGAAARTFIVSVEKWVEQGGAAGGAPPPATTPPGVE